MTRDDAIPYIAWGIDDALCPFDVEQITEEQMARAKLVGWQCGFDSVFVAVWSYLGGKVDDIEAEDIATDWLIEKGWFNNGVREPDYIL